jgi:tartrate dehydratase alpha subunit/fumarate hydratase class I-like protein
MRPIDQRNEKPFYADLERELLEKVNALGIGPQGFGGKTTAPGRQHRISAHPHRRPAGGGQSQLPRHPAKTEVL